MHVCQKYCSALLAILAMPILSQCRTTQSSTPQSVRDFGSVFPNSSIMVVQLTTDPADWDKLRFEGNDLGTLVCNNSSRVDYAQYDAKMTINGKSLGGVKIRKKGFLGSLLQARPSLKVKLNSESTEGNFKGLSRLVLNSNNQDPALMRQCLAYEVFRASGSVVPGCSFARVSVNGKDLGIYTNIEDFSPGFFGEKFGNKDGVLIEGTLSDFSPAYSATFEVKMGDEALGQAKIQAVTSILSSNPPDLVQKLEEHIDLEKFFRFWATEVLIGHWDGFANNRNNFYIYVSKQTGKMEFIPWGVDGVFSPSDPFYKGSGERPVAIAASSKLTSMLLKDPEGSRRYAAAMKSVLSDAWNVPELKQRIQSFHAMLGSEILESSYATLSSYIDTRGELITRQLAAVELDWPVPYNEERNCIKDIGNFEAKFATKWLGDITPRTPGGGNGKMNFTLNGETVSLDAIYSVSGNSESLIRSQPTVILTGKKGSDTYIAMIYIERGIYEPRATVKFQGFSTFGVLVKVSATGVAERKGLISTGSVQFEDAAATANGLVSGSMTAKLYSMP